MRTYIIDTFPRLNRLSSRLDFETNIANKAWIHVDVDTKSKVVYRFLNDNKLYITVDGKAKQCTWEFLEDGSSLMIGGVNDNSYVFKHSFIDDTVLALKLDNNAEEFSIFFNEAAYQRFEDNSFDTILDYLRSKVKYNLAQKVKVINRFSVTYPSSSSIQVAFFDSFVKTNYLELAEDISIIKEKFQLLITTKHAAAILISFCESHSVPIDISQHNKELLQLLNNRKLPIAFIEKIMNVHKTAPIFINEFKSYLISELSE